jgi:ribosomal protein S25
MKEKVIKQLNEHMQEVINRGYDEERILGIFLYGSQNYGFATEKSDVDSRVIIFPTFEEFCLQKDWVSKTIELENGEHIDIKDIRLFRENLLKQNINFMENLFTEYCIINPRYEELFNTWFINNRERFADMNKARGMSSIAHQLKHTVNQDKTDYKKLYNGERLCYFLSKWAAGAPYGECLRPEGDIAKLMMDIKTGQVDWDEEKKIQKADEYIWQAVLYINLAPMFDIDEEAVKLLDRAPVELIKANFEEPESGRHISKEEFFSHLTNLEEQAYNAIIKEIGAFGTVVVSKLVKDTAISRPVYNNLIEKLKLYKIAEITSMGVKGMNIKIIHPLLKIETEASK